MEQSTSRFNFLTFVSEEEKKLDLKKRVDTQRVVHLNTQTTATMSLNIIHFRMITTSP